MRNCLTSKPCIINGSTCTARPFTASMLLTAALAWATHAPAQAPQPSRAQPTAPVATAPAPAAPAGKPAEPPQEPPTEAERLIDLAIKKIAGLKSVSADMVQNVDMLKQKFDIKGRYLKAPRFPHLPQAGSVGAARIPTAPSSRSATARPSGNTSKSSNLRSTASCLSSRSSSV